MVDPIGRSSPLPPDQDSIQEQEASQRLHVTVPPPPPPESELAGGGIGAKGGAKIGGGSGTGGQVHIEGGIDTFGGAYIDSGIDVGISTPGFKAGGDVGGRYYHWDDTGKFSRGEGGGHWEVGRPGASKGASGRVVWDNNPITPEVSGKNWNQLGGKFVERTGADSLERDGASTGFHGVFFGFENDHRFNPEGLRYERNEHIGALNYFERDVLGLVDYDPPSANVYTTTKTGVGVMRVGAYVSEMEKERLDSDWALNRQDAFDQFTREKAAASYAQLSLAPRSAEVLDGLGLGTREAFFGHIEENINNTNLPGDLVVSRMHVAINQAAIAVENDPTKSAEQAFAEQPAINRPGPDRLVMDQRLSPVEALDVALARADGDMRPIQDIINSRSLSGASMGSDFANDAVTMDAIYGYMSGQHPNFDAVVAAAEAHRAGDTRSAGALIIDYHEDGVIDGSNVVNVSFGDETYAVLPGGGKRAVTQPDGTIKTVDAMDPDTARGLLSMIETVRQRERANKVDVAKSVIDEAARQGVSFDDQRELYHQVRRSQEQLGDNRNAEALIADSQDNGFVDGSNLPEATIGDQTYAISTGGGVMHGRTTMTPTELAARANAHAAYGGTVDGDAVAKARADAMTQSLRDGLSAQDQIAASDLALTAPGDASVAVRQDLLSMIDNPALADQERKAIEGMIDHVQQIEAAARFEGAKGLADAEYGLSLQMQERRALDDMIAAAKELDALADVPIPEFKPHIPIPAFKPDMPQPQPTDGPDMRDGKVAYGRGTVDHGPFDRGPKNVAYDNFNDWANDMRDMFSGNGPKEGVATPNAAEEKAAAQKHEGGENRGQQNDIPEAGSKENDAATSAEFDAMGKSTSGPDEDDKAKAEAEAKEKAEKEAKEKAEKKNSGQKHEGGENRGQQRDSNADNNYGAPDDGIY